MSFCLIQGDEVCPDLMTPHPPLTRSPQSYAKHYFDSLQEKAIVMFPRLIEVTFGLFCFFRTVGTPVPTFFGESSVYRGDVQTSFVNGTDK